MAAKVESAGNDTKGIKDAMDDLGKLIADLSKQLEAMKKAQAQVAKEPDECAKPAQLLHDGIAVFLKDCRALEPIDKALKSAVAK
jgi:hypothetical protein